MRYHFIRDNRCSFPVTKMCQTFHISQWVYYRWCKRPFSVRLVKNKRLRERIQELYTEHRGMAGSPMITADLRAEPEFSSVGKNRVARQMKTMGLKCKTAKKYIVTTDSKHNEPVAPNLLNRQFSVASPNIAWVSDITYVKVGSKWNYLTVFIDLYSRIVVGWDLSASLDRHSMIYAFKKALLRRRPGQGLLVHSDRGVQYASADFRKLLQKTEFVQSMSRKGNCWDNAVAESFFHTLKTQFLYHHRFTNRSEAEQALFKYIEIYYNRRRRHSTNGNPPEKMLH
jgi:putative transposase